MIISKAIELLNHSTKETLADPGLDTLDAIMLGREALKRIQDVRLHPFHPVYSPLPGESMPERGVRVELQVSPKKKTK